MLSRFHLIPERNGQTDGQTDRFAISISRVNMLTRDKNYVEWQFFSERHIRFLSELNKCIGDDTKAAARQRPNCSKKKTKINKIWRNTIFNMGDGIITPCNVAQLWHWFRQVTAPCNVACGSRIMTVNSPSGSTLPIMGSLKSWCTTSYRSSIEIIIIIIIIYESCSAKSTNENDGALHSHKTLS